MKDAKLQQVIMSDNVGLYSICFDNNAMNESLKNGVLSIERNVITGIQEASFKV